MARCSASRSATASSCPACPAPYVVAQVALEEDPRVKLTTRIVEAEPDDLRLGMRMEVVFEQVEDVWLPLFRPTAEQPEPAPLPADELPAERVRALVRPMRGTRKFEDDVRPLRHRHVRGWGAG